MDALNQRLDAAGLVGAKVLPLLAEKADAPVLMPACVDLWTHTAPIPSADPEAALFLHGPRREPASVQLIWRADLDFALGHEGLRALLALAPPRAAEALELPVWAARNWLTHHHGPDLADVDQAASPEKQREGLASSFAGVARKISAQASYDTSNGMPSGPAIPSSSRPPTAVATNTAGRPTRTILTMSGPMMWRRKQAPLLAQALCRADHTGHAGAGDHQRRASPARRLFIRCHSARSARRSRADNLQGKRCARCALSVGNGAQCPGRPRQDSPSVAGQTFAEPPSPSSRTNDHRQLSP